MKKLVAFMMASTFSFMVHANPMPLADVSLDKDFGDVAVGDGMSEVYTVNAPADQTLWVTDMSLDGKGFWVESDCLGELPAGYSCYVEVNFEPSAVGDYMATMKMMTTVDNYTLNLKGKGVEAAPQHHEE